MLEALGIDFKGKQVRTIIENNVIIVFEVDPATGRSTDLAQIKIGTKSIYGEMKKCLYSIKKVA